MCPYSKEYYERNRERILARNKEWRKKNREHVRQFVRQYQRNNYLGINGEAIRVKKRAFQGKCELCGREIDIQPNWHHWDDEHLEKGLWLCNWCHILAESVERYEDISNKELIEKYKQLKEQINKNNSLENNGLENNLEPVNLEVVSIENKS